MSFRDPTSWADDNYRLEHTVHTIRVAIQSLRPFYYVMLPLSAVLWLAFITNRQCSKYAAEAAPVAAKQVSFEKDRLPVEASDSKRDSILKATDRELGVWEPVGFKRPPASPYPNWSVHTTKPLPYRPFRYGPRYQITMGLRNMQWDDWIELDNQYSRFHADKKQRILERGSKCCMTAPEAFEGAIELLEEFCDYLPQRYPSLFRKTDVGMDNLLTGESFNIMERPLKEDPMQMGGRMVQDDFVIMFEKADGQYYLLAGSILLPGFWRLGDKFGMPLSEIHTSGNVPVWKEKLERGTMNLFRRITPDRPVVRNNYYVQTDDGLAWNYTIGAEDDEGIGLYSAEKNRPIEAYHYRSERQSLRR